MTTFVAAGPYENAAAEQQQIDSRCEAVPGSPRPVWFAPSMKDADMRLGALIVRFSGLVTQPLGPTTTVADIANHTPCFHCGVGLCVDGVVSGQCLVGQPAIQNAPDQPKQCLNTSLAGLPCPMESSSGSRPSPGLHPVKAHFVKSSAPESGSVCTRCTADRHTSTLTFCWTLFQGCVRCFWGGLWFVRACRRRCARGCSSHCTSLTRSCACRHTRERRQAATQTRAYSSCRKPTPSCFYSWSGSTRR